MPIVTVGRQYGAGGETVGQIVASELGADYVDREIVREVALRLEMPEAEVEAQSEAPGSLVSRILRSLGAASIEWGAPPDATAWTPPYQDPSLDPRRAMLEITQEVIREAARGGNAVIVGHGAAYLLRDEPRALHVFLRASEDFRAEVVRGALGVGDTEARKRIKHVDANRAAYIKQLYGHDWNHPAHYDLVIDTGRLGFEGAAATVLAAVRAMRQ